MREALEARYVAACQRHFRDVDRLHQLEEELELDEEAKSAILNLMLRKCSACQRAIIEDKQHGCKMHRELVLKCGQRETIEGVSV